MEENQNKALPGPSTFQQNHPATNGLNVATNAAISTIGGKKTVALRSILEDDPHAADVKWSLFVAACQGYRYDSCLKPFPPQFFSNGTKDIDSLREVVNKTPTLDLLRRHLDDRDLYQSIPQVIDLLYWVLVHVKDVRIKSVPKSEFKSIMEKVHCETAAPAPNLIFQLVGNPNGTSEMRWQRISRDCKTFYAFHGSRLDNFHSILHYGLQQHLNKNSLFGHGIYLSSELSVSLPYSPMGYGWGKSIVGGEMSCVALCEVINHPDVKCQDKESDKSRSIAKDSIGGEVPQKYYVVLNSDLVKVRYLLVYSKQPPQATTIKSGSWLGWIGRHKLLTFIVGYIVLLASVGLSSNHMVQRYYNLMLRKAGF